MRKILRILGNIVKPLKAWSLPRNVDVEITNLCELQCDMCPRQGFTKERKLGSMSLDNFRYLLNQLEDVPCLTFSGNGEALLHPQFMEFLRLARQAGKKLTISTNGLELNRFSHEELRELVPAFTAIVISLDSPYKDKYEAIRAKASFAKVMEGIKRLAQFKDEGKANIAVHLVYRDQSKKELEDMIELVRKTGLDKLSIGKLMNYQGSKIEEERAITRNDIKTLQKLAREQGLEIIFNFFEEFGWAKRFVGCNWPWRYAFISYEGVVTPCCSLKDPLRLNMGNIFEEDFQTIWQGKRYRELRKNIRGGHFLTVCQEVQCWYVDKKFHN